MNLDQLFKRTRHLSTWLCSHEDRNRRVHLFTNLMAVVDIQTGWILAPINYLETAETCPEGLVRGKWRPSVYYFKNNMWTRDSSQHELLWRRIAADLPWEEAEYRAKELLLDQLNEHQLCEYTLTGSFTVRGGSTRNIYVIHKSNGFSLIDDATREELVNYCLHPEHWMPDDDIALATKFALECPETELSALDRATPFVQRTFCRELYLSLGDVEKAKRFPKHRKPTRIERYARDMELELL